jgi:ADP-ribose pyrophosphatase YjhB (NUDIX family)
LVWDDRVAPFIARFADPVRIDFATMKFCPACGAAVERKVPAGDTLPRHVCMRCGTIHYHNPKLVIGSIPVWEDRFLLCKRAIEPRYGKWTLPAGFMENDETVAQAALRETLEEANARVELGELFSMLSVPHINQVHLFYQARLLDLDFHPGTESLEVRLFDATSIPWDELAFRTVSQTLRFFLQDRSAGTMRLHCGDIAPRQA